MVCVGLESVFDTLHAFTSHPSRGKNSAIAEEDIALASCSGGSYCNLEASFGH